MTLADFVATSLRMYALLNRLAMSTLHITWSWSLFLVCWGPVVCCLFGWILK